MIRIVKLNAQPILMPLDQPPASVGGIDLETARSRARQIAEYPPFAQAVGQAIASRYADKEPPQYVEQRIYEGFPSRADTNLMVRFHAVPWSERPAIVARLTDERLRELGERLVYLEAPEALPAEVRCRYDAWRRSRLLADQTAPWVGLAMARKDLAEQNGASTGMGDGFLAEIETYLAQVEAGLVGAKGGLD